MEPYQELERRFGESIGNPNTVACSSGTAALHLALETLGVHGRIAIPEFTMVACARAAVMAGATPVFVDCTDDLLLSLDVLESVLPCQAVMPVHIYGRHCPMERLAVLARQTGMLVIEDLAEAHGVRPHAATDAACWSFYRNKIVAGEEGGIVAFKHAYDAEQARLLRSLGFTKEHDFRHLPRGVNCRLSNANAALIAESLLAVQDNLARRRVVEDWYDGLVPQEWRMPPREVPWVYDLRIPGLWEFRQRQIVGTLNQAGIAARHGFKPMSEQPEFLAAHTHLNAYRLSREIIYLPILPQMTFETVQEIIGATVEAAGKARSRQ